jgi:streptogramin lyase
MTKAYFSLKKLLGSRGPRNGATARSPVRLRLGIEGLKSRCLLSANPTITEFPLPTPNTIPSGIVAGPDGALWFTEVNGANGGIGRITPTGNVIEFHTGIIFASQPEEITVGPDGNLWFTEQFGGICSGASPSLPMARHRS